MAVKTPQEIVGNSNVLDSEDYLNRYAGDASLAPKVRPKCVIKVQKTDDVKELVDWANETDTVLVPVSSGEPHFRGDTVPSVGGAAILDLSGLNETVRVDGPNRIALIQAGVTFGDLIPKLKAEGIRLNMPLAPRANKSVVASLLDREAVLMPVYQWDSQDPLT